jgi:hypothetical protein
MHHPRAFHPINTNIRMLTSFPSKRILPSDWYLLLTPYLFALHILLEIYTLIMPDTPFRQVYSSLGLAFLLASLLVLFMLKLTGNIPKAALLTSLAVVLLLSYGQIHRAVQQTGNIDGLFSDHLFLSLSLLVLFLICTYSVLKIKIQVIDLISKYILMVAAIASLFPAYYILPYSIARAKDPLEGWEAVQDRPFDLPSLTNSTQPTRTPPDIYYIVLDSYGRADVLNREFSYENSEFLSYLEARGFYIASQSRSNYFLTILSIASTLNLNYLNPLDPEVRNSQNREPLKDLIQHSQLRQYLAGQGYKYVAFDSGYAYTRTPDADLYFEPFAWLNEFEELFMTFSSAVLVEGWRKNPLPYFTYNSHRTRIVYTLEKLKEMPLIPGPKIVFAHLLIPHPPFVFDKDGKSIEPDHPYNINDADLYPGTREEYLQGYAGQVEFTNRQMQALIDRLLNDSPVPPVIVIQGDHGPRMLIDWSSPENSCLLESSAILNAIYLPENDPGILYSSITPVNNFRVILNEYFGTDLDLLEDRTYFSNYENPYDYLDVSSQVKDYCNAQD